MDFSFEALPDAGMQVIFAADEAPIELPQAGNASRHITADALSQLEDATKKRANFPKGAPRWISQTFRRTLETHAAQLAANQAADGSAASASEGSASTAAIAAALQRRAQQKINAKPASVPMTPMTTDSLLSQRSKVHHPANQAVIVQLRNPNEWKSR
eukprot:5932167-Amphidinium_carterae.1